MDNSPLYEELKNAILNAGSPIEKVSAISKAMRTLPAPAYERLIKEVNENESK